MIMVAALAGTWAAIRFAKREKLSEVVVLDMAIIAIIASMLGARLFHVFFEAPDYYWEKPIRVFYFWQGGFVSLGAFIASICSWFVYFRIKKVNAWQYYDISASIAPIIIFFVRMGCLANGCCYGRPTTHWPSVTFTNPTSTACLMKFCNIPLHPTQAYFMLNAVVMFFFLLVVRKYRKFYGQIGASFLMYEGASRFFIEFYRGDWDRGLYFGGWISTGQIVMVLFFLAGLGMWIYCRKRYETTH
jgi:phosphatidylglycerol:prolipoprotein diacylglycerol transferase